MSAPYFVAIGPEPERAVELNHDAYVSRAGLERRGWSVVAERETWADAEMLTRRIAALPTVERWWAALWQHRAQEVE